MSVDQRLRVGVWPGVNRGGNPFVDLFADGLREAGAVVVDVENPADIPAVQCDVFHIHWPEQVFRVGGGLRGVSLNLLRTVGSLRRLRRSGVIIVWMVHNLEPHDMSWKRRVLWWVYMRQLCALSDGFMTLSPATIEIVKRELPGLRHKPAQSGWMPAYPVETSRLSRDEIRTQLGLSMNARVFAWMGLLRPYKGIETLIDVFRQLPGEEFSLLIAGAPFDEAYSQMLRGLADRDPRIKFVLRHLSDAEFADYQNAADVVVLPFHRYLHSGSMVHALCSGKPVLTPDTPFARSLGEEVGDGWIQTYVQPLRPGILLEVREPAAPARLDALSPRHLGHNAVEFYRSLGRPDRDTKDGAAARH